MAAILYRFRIAIIVLFIALLALAGLLFVQGYNNRKIPAHGVFVQRAEPQCITGYYWMDEGEDL